MATLVLIEEELAITQETLVVGMITEEEIAMMTEEAIAMITEEVIAMIETATAIAEVAMVEVAATSTTADIHTIVGTQAFFQLLMDWLGIKMVPNSAISTLLEFSAHKWQSKTHASAIKMELAAIRLGPTPAFNASNQVL